MMNNRGRKFISIHYERLFDETELDIQEMGQDTIQAFPSFDERFPVRGKYS